jgi:hypothetical protein
LSSAFLATGCSRGASPSDGPVDDTGRIGFPLAGPPPNGFSRHEDVGARFTNGQLVVFNLGDDDIRILDVTAELTGEGLVLLGSRLAGLERSIGSNQYEDRFPPQDANLGATVDAVGAVLPPGRESATYGFEVLIGFEVTKTGRATVKSVDLTYEYKGVSRRQTFVSTMAICVPVTAVECPPEYGGYGD